jgi:hypothetical protein
MTTGALSWTLIGNVLENVVANSSVVAGATNSSGNQ